MRLTSSMRATLRSVVRPRLSSDAQSSATPAFFDDFTSIEPDSMVPPTTRRCIGACRPSETSSLVERLADAGEHLDAQVLAALLDAVDGALAGAEGLGQASLGEAPVLAGVADERADLAEVGLGADRSIIRHVPTIISYMR